MQRSAGVAPREDPRRSDRIERIAGLVGAAVICEATFANIGRAGLPGEDPTDYFDAVSSSIRAASSELTKLQELLNGTPEGGASSRDSKQNARRAGSCRTGFVVAAVPCKRETAAGPRGSKPVYYRFGFPIPRLRAVNSERIVALANGDDRVKVCCDNAFRAFRRDSRPNSQCEGRGFESLRLQSHQPLLIKSRGPIV